MVYILGLAPFHTTPHHQDIKMNFMNGEGSLFLIHFDCIITNSCWSFCRYQCFSANCVPDYDQWVSFLVSTWMNTDYCMITSQQMHFKCIKRARLSLKVICIRFYLQTTFEYWLVCFQLQTQTQRQQAATSSTTTTRAWTTTMRVSFHLISCTTFIPLTWLEFCRMDICSCCNPQGERLQWRQGWWR